MTPKGLQTRKTIVEKSLHLFSVKGYYNTSVRDILTATGLTKGGLYGHFASKEEIWNAAYDEAIRIWKSIVFRGIRSRTDPLKRLELFIENDMQYYLGEDTFEGGCFFLNMMVELAGQSAAMSKQIFRGFVHLSNLIETWLKEAENAGRIRKGLNLREVADFIIISLNGAAALYISSRDASVLSRTVHQLKFYIRQLSVDKTPEASTSPMP